MTFPVQEVFTPGVIYDQIVDVKPESYNKFKVAVKNTSA